MSREVVHAVRLDMRSYDTPAAVKKFSQLVPLLPPHASLNDRNVASLVGRIIAKNEECLGYKAPKPRPITKLPSKLFHNCSPNGSLYHIIKSYFTSTGTYQFREDMGHDQMIHLFRQFQEVLLNYSLLHFPRIFLSQGLTADSRANLTKIIQEHHGTIVENEAEATHKVVPSPLIEQENRDYARVQHINGNFAYVHWYFYPDSYDTWIPRSGIQGPEPPPKAPHTGQWTVVDRWVTDLDLFNEYMSEKDYTLESITELKQYILPTPTSTGIGEKRPAGEHPQAPEAKKQAISMVIEPQYHKVVPQIPGNVVHSQSDFSIKAECSFLNVSQQSGLQIVREREIQSKPCPWFDKQKIHNLERRSLPQIFQTGSFQYMEDDDYIRLRNQIITMFEENPSKYLPVSPCATISPTMPIAALLQIHSFLESREIINYVTSPDIFVSPPSVEESKGAPLVCFKKTEEEENELLQEKLERPNVLKKVFAVCRECKIACGNSRWHHESDFDLCDECYGDGKFGIEFHSLQFTHVETPSIKLEHDWTPEETLSLLQAIVKHKENLNWHSISEEIPGRSKDACLLHFIQLPFQDPFLEHKLQKWTEAPTTTYDLTTGTPFPITAVKDEKMDVDEATEGKIGATDSAEVLNDIKKEDLPFISTNNPVMSVITFLGSQIGGPIAEAAAVEVKKFVQMKQEAKETCDLRDPSYIIELYKRVLQGAREKANEIRAQKEQEILLLAEEAVQLTLDKIQKKLTLLKQEMDRETNQINQLTTRCNQ